MSSSSSSMCIKNIKQPLNLYIKKLSNNAIIPTRGTEYSAGLDLSSAIDICIPKGERKLIPTDLSIVCPIGTYGRIAPRSG